MIKHIVLDLDDLTIFNHQSQLFNQIREHFPTFKVSCFTIPTDLQHEMSLQRINKEESLKEFKKNLEFVQIIPHGLTHMKEEFLHADRVATKLAIKAIDDAFAKDDIPYVKGFKAPFWQWNKDVVDVLDELGWWGAIDRVNRYEFKPKTFYQHDYSLAEPFWKSDKETIKVHGHVDGVSDNDLSKCVLGLMKLPADIEWHFVTEYLESSDDGKLQEVNI